MAYSYGINRNVITSERVNLEFMVKWERTELNQEVTQFFCLKAWPVTSTQHQFCSKVVKRKSPKIWRNSCLNQGDMQLLDILFLPLFSHLFPTANKMNTKQNHVLQLCIEWLVQIVINYVGQWFFLWHEKHTWLKQVGPLIQLCDPGLLQPLPQVYDQELLTDGVCSEPKIHSHYEEH